MTDNIHTILFDLDGTLLDTAPDLADALNQVLHEYGHPTRSFDEIRPVVSHGGIALISFGFDMEPDSPDFEALRQRFLDIYHNNLARKTRPFPGMEELLEAIETRKMKWGVVTNKPSWLTDPLMDALQLSDRASCIVSGDTVEQKKPHPMPMHHACNQCGSKASQCIYVGDAQRDIEAGNRAGMKTLVALFGYIGEEDQPESWQADGMVTQPMEILEFIDRYSTSGSATGAA
jgi:phosphoglycolate phosphatase